MAFRRLEHKLRKLDERLEHKCHPEGIAYIVVSRGYFTTEERDKFTYEELVTFAKLRAIQTEHIHFLNWEEYRAMRKRVGNNDVFGEVEIKEL